MKKVYIFPGQGSQYVGMGKDLYESNSYAKELFERANDILGFRITDIMFNGTDDDLKCTKVTQPSVFLHSVISALCLNDFKPDMLAGHSLGELSAIVVGKAISFEDGLNLVYNRALAMQKACDLVPSTMAAIIGLPDDVVNRVCLEVSQGGELVVAANFNCPGQVVISGGIDAIKLACKRLKNEGAKRALPLIVGGAFHSPYMESARDELAVAINKITFNSPICPIYQNVDALPHTSPDEIKENLLKQLTAPVLWTQVIQRMFADGAEQFIECGPGSVLTGLLGKILTK